jgi:hypothetical protein
MNKARKKPGPQPKLARHRRSCIVRATVTPAELKAIKAAARPATISNWSRAVLVAAAKGEA